LSWFGLKKKRDAEREFMSHVFVHQEAMYRYALRLCGSEAEAQDLVQEAMTKALKSFERIRPDTNHRAWVFTIIRNTFISRVRKTSREALVDSIEEVEGLSIDVEAPTGAALEALGGDRFKEGFEDEVLAALQALPEAQRTALVLCDIEGLEYEHIATVLDCPVGTVRSRIHHGRKRLKAALAGYAAQKGYRNVESHG
jgi:RNA polymerase sigma-70 factor (ECF subfamily)